MGFEKVTVRNMTKKRVYIVLFCIILCFIWGNSMLSREVSGAISHFIADIFGGEQGATDEGHYLLRKAAHFCEFASLGAVFYLLAKEVVEHRGFRLTLCALVGISVPLIDETIQIFSGRGAALSDVWLDISGYVFGSVICALIAFAVAKRKKKCSQ